MSTKLKFAALAVLCITGAGLVFAQQPGQNSPFRPDQGGGATGLFGPNPLGRPAQGQPDPDQRLADIEKRLEGLLADVKALRKDLKKSGAGTTVIKLKKADALLAGKMLNTVFDGRGGMSVVVDSDTNSVHIKAGEKELTEARKLLEVLDEGKPTQEAPTRPSGPRQ
jgi:hypothetical protein